MKVIYNDGHVGEIEKEEELHVIRHTAAHIMAQAILRLHPQAKFAYGPATERGFYYDVDLGEEKLTDADLQAIEAEMKKICKENLPIKTYELPREEAIALMESRGEIYKVEHIGDLPEDARITFYQQGDYIDMCVGPHLTYTKTLKAFKITQQSGAYWKNDKNNKMLTRINGIAFRNQTELDEYLKLMEEAEKRDHRRLGKEMKLFTLLEEGPGFPFFLPKGMVLRNTLLDYWHQVHKKFGYVEISTPIILNQDLWHRSGHWDHRDLPLRMAELGLVHRHELSGALHGLFRVRCFTQDDAHIFMTWDQMESEIQNVVRLFDEVYSTFGLSYQIEVSTMPEDHIGEVETWDFATETLKRAITGMGKDYIINEGDGAFYGPKLDFHLADSLGRTWQCGTIQLDMQMPERFELEYVGEDGQKHRPVMIHRVVLGSIERFIGVITEHFAGKFPVWLAPTQVKVLPVSEKSLDYARELTAALDAAGIRVELDERNEKIGYKIREAQQVERVPYMLVIGAKEVEAGNVTYRSRDTGESTTLSLAEFISKVQQETKELK